VLVACSRRASVPTDSATSPSSARQATASRRRRNRSPQQPVPAQLHLAEPPRRPLQLREQPDRTAALRKLDVPTVVVHGLADRMVHVSGGRATAAAIPGAELVLIPGMGHDLPPELDDTIGDAIERNIRRAERQVKA